MEKLQQYNETRGNMASFVAVVARSAALDYCRGSMRKTGELVGDEKLDFLAEPIKIEDSVNFKLLVETIAAKLNEQENVLFAMRYIYFYTPEEIAKVFKINRNAVDARLSRLKKKIKNLLIKGGATI
jgi:RNA polymerase sigma factor (sigma-70 family)